MKKKIVSNVWATARVAPTRFFLEAGFGALMGRWLRRTLILYIITERLRQ
jgi:hypothetical protein